MCLSRMSGEGEDIINRVYASKIEEKLSLDIMEKSRGTELRGFIHSVFSRVINISIGERLITVGTEFMEEAPDAVHVRNRSEFSGTEIENNGPVTICDGKVWIGTDLLIETKGANRYQLEPFVFIPYDGEGFHKRIGEIENLVRIYGYNGELYQAYFHQKNSSEVTAMFKERLSLIRQSAYMKTMNGILAGLGGMAGLGFGLTPSGDDFIAGYLYVYYYCLPREREKYLALAEDCGKATNRISYTMIGQAAAGRARKSEQDLMRALIRNDREKIRESTHKILQFGSSSGTDIILGMLTAMKSLSQF